MPTTIITGRDVSFTISATQYSSQATSAILTVDTTINTYQTLQEKAILRLILRELLRSKCSQIGERVRHYVKLSGMQL
jgi:hypothetical protein